MFYSVIHWNSHVQISYVLVPILSHLTVDEFSVHDSFSFVTKISEEYCLDHFVASLNVNNLFPNIYLGKAIDIWINELFFKRDTIQNLGRNPANICLVVDVLKTFSRGLSSYLQKASSRSLDQDEYIRLTHRSLEDVFKTSWSKPIYSPWSYVFKTSCKNVFKTSSRHLQDVFKTSLRCLQDIIKTSN